MGNRLTVPESQILGELHFVLDGDGNAIALESICYHGKSLFPYEGDFSVKYVFCFLGRERPDLFVLMLGVMQS